MHLGKEAVGSWEHKVAVQRPRRQAGTGALWADELNTSKHSNKELSSRKGLFGLMVT